MDPPNRFLAEMVSKSRSIHFQNQNKLMANAKDVSIQVIYCFLTAHSKPNSVPRTNEYCEESH